jgi:hypothetical protein
MHPNPCEIQITLIYVLCLFSIEEKFQKVGNFTRNCWKEAGIYPLTSKKEKWSWSRGNINDSKVILIFPFMEERL